MEIIAVVEKQTITTVGRLLIGENKTLSLYTSQAVRCQLCNKSNLSPCRDFKTVNITSRTH